MTAHQSALVKTAMTLGLIAIIMAIATVWPLFIGYLLMVIFFGLLAFLIYAAFRMIEETNEWRRKRN